jgi:hypothetical protein
VKKPLSISRACVRGSSALGGWPRWWGTERAQTFVGGGYLVSFILIRISAAKLIMFAAQLKVNLRPLWSPAIAALSSLSQRFGDLVWQILFEELKASQTAEGVSQLPSQQGHSEVDQGSEDSLDRDRWEDERSWRDPSGHKLRVVSAQWDDETHSSREYVQVREIALTLDGPFS